MPTAKKLVNTALVLFILFSIPVTVLVARRSSNLASRASGEVLSLQISPSTRSLNRGSSSSFTLSLDFPDLFTKTSSSVLLHFDQLPPGVSIHNQPLGATPSNNYQKVHIFTVVADPTAAIGTYKIGISASDLSRTETTSFSLEIK